MSDEELELLITLDDPWYGPDYDTFHHVQSDSGWAGLTYSFRHARILPMVQEGGAGLYPKSPNRTWIGSVPSAVADE